MKTSSHTWRLQYSQNAYAKKQYPISRKIQTHHFNQNLHRAFWKSFKILVLTDNVYACDDVSFQELVLYL